MIGRRDSVTESRILQGRDARSIRVLISDSRGLDQNVHGVTVVDMGDLPEFHVSITELSDLANKWPLAVINQMRWRQPELEEMRRAARVQQPAPCTFVTPTMCQRGSRTSDWRRLSRRGRLHARCIRNR